MELAAFAALLAGVSLVVGRELLTTSPRFQFAPPLIAGVAAAGLLLAACLAARGEEDQAQKAPAATSAVKPAVKKLVKPKGWPADHPLPLVGSNCAACHLTAATRPTT